MAQNDDSKLSRHFQGIWIPREIWLHSTLSIQAKVLWAEIKSLYNEECDGCFASDEYLMNFLGVRLSRLHEVLKELRDANLLINMNTDRRNRIMKAINPEVDGSLTSGKPEMTLPENRKLEFRKTGNVSIYSNKKEIKEENITPPTPLKGEDATASVVAEMKSISIKNFGKFVKLTDPEHHQLTEIFGDIAVRDIIEQINDHLASTGKKPYKDYAATIRNWLRRKKESQSSSHRAYSNQPDRRQRDRFGNVAPNPYEGIF